MFPLGWWYVQHTWNLARKTLMWFWVRRNKFCQRLVACAEGPFTTVRIITRPAKRREANKVFRHQYRKLTLCLDFWWAYWPIPNRDLSLMERVIFLTVVSSLLTGARLYEFSWHLEYYLWYTPANSPIGFWNRLNLTIAMAGHLFRHSTSTIGTTALPNIYVWGKL